MKTKKILLPGMMAALAFAACTNEEIVTMPNVAPEVDLSNRPVIGMVDLSFGPESQTRLALDENGIYSSIAWAPTDKMGARIIDAPNSNNYSDHSLNYGYSSYASSNYKYTRGENGVWTTEALMVEGNYMFYAPYDENARGREALQVEFPINQTIDPASTLMAGVNVDAIRNFYGNDGQYVVAIGHKFLSAKDNTTSYKVNYNHLYAFPQITLKNDYKVDLTNDYVSNPTAQPITVNEVVIKSSNIKHYYKVSHEGVITAYQDATVKDVVANRTDGYTNYNPGDANLRKLGLWRVGDAATYLSEAKTADVLTAIDLDKAGEPDTDGVIVVTFEPALQIPAGGSYSFNVVMPAAAYSDLQVEVRTKDAGKAYVWSGADFVEDFTSLTYAPGNQYPVQEYNDLTAGKTPVLKNTKGALATYSLSGTKTEVNPDPAFNGYVTEAQFINYLNSIKDNSLQLVEKRDDANADFFFAPNHQIVLNANVIAAIERNLVNGKITFNSPMVVDGVELVGSKYEFKGNLTTKGNVTLKGVSVGGKLIQNSGSLTLAEDVSVTGNADFKAVTLTDATVSGAVTFNGDATIADLTGATSATINSGLVKVNGTAEMGEIAIKGGELEVNVEDYIDQKITVGYTKDNGDIVGATLTINKPNTFGSNVFFVGGDIELNAEVTGIGESYFSANWTSGTLTIGENGVITSTEFTNKDVLVNYGSSSAAINNPAGSEITNYATLTVAKNEGAITTKPGSSTYVNAGTEAGSIDNTAKAALFFADSSVKNIVSYTFSEQATSATIEALKTKNYLINKVVFNAGINFDKNFTAADVFWGVDYIDVKGNISIAEGVMIGVNVLALNVLDNVTVDGFSQALSGLGFTDPNTTTITVAKNKTLTIKEAAFGSVGNNTLSFVFEQPAADDDDSVKAGALKLQNAYVGYGSQGTAPVAEKDAYSTLTNTSWDGTAWQ